MQRTSLVTVTLIAVFALTISSSWARIAPFDGIGGNGGAPYRLDCGESAVLVGITGNSGAVIDRIAGLCVKIDPVCGIWVGGVYETSPAGGTGGGRFQKSCPVGHALIGIEGTTKYFAQTYVVDSLSIVCTELRIKTQTSPHVIKGFRQVGISGDPEPWKIPALQDLCYRPLPATNRSQDDWSPIGLALEGRAGVYVDRVHVVCGDLLRDTQGYRVTFRSSAKTAVPEGTPLNIQCRATSARPELTPNLQFSWELRDWTHMKPAIIGQQPTIVQNACAYALPPCNSGWFGSTSSSQVTFNALPPAQYELLVTAKPTVPTPFQSQVPFRFEIAQNRLVELKANPNTIRPGQNAIVAIVLEGPVPPRGTTVYFSSSDPQRVTVPGLVKIPGGANTGTVTLHAVGSSIGPVTITASLTEFVALQGVQSEKSVRSAGLLSRGIEGGESSTSSAEATTLTREGDTVLPTADTPISETSDQNQDVTERGIAGLRTRPVTGASQSQTPASTPQTHSSAGAVSKMPSDFSAAVLTQPSARKQIVITVQPDLEMQRNDQVQPNLDRFKQP